MFKIIINNSIDMANFSLKINDILYEIFSKAFKSLFLTVLMI